MASQVTMDLKAAGQPVTCLGKTFANEDERREHFRSLLRERLADPAFRATPGFPEGADDDIVKMSDPPYYTACPNPFINDWLGDDAKRDTHATYIRAPLAIDVSVGKTDPLYKAHGYHTKVPHQAIVPSILHYTDPEDIVLDAFGGSGMVGVAAAYCGNAPAAYRSDLGSNWKLAGRDKPRWGARRAILNDLSPAASFIASNYVSPIDVAAFEREASNLLSEVFDEIGWMYETNVSGQVARIEYVVWSQRFSCPNCAEDIVFSELESDEGSGSVKDTFNCPSCGSSLNKRALTRQFEHRLDREVNAVVRSPARTPVKICYTIGGKRGFKTPDGQDLATLKRIEELDLPTEVPRTLIPEMHMTHERAKMAAFGIEHIHQFFLPRAAHAVGTLWKKANAIGDDRIRRMMLFTVEQSIWSLSVMNRYRPSGFSQFGQYMTGIYYVASQHAECSPWYILDGKTSRLAKAFRSFRPGQDGSIVTTGTAAHIPMKDSSVDYIFTDPPFGENIYYADLNFLVEAFHGVVTDSEPEAIIDKNKNKTIDDYQILMQECFSEYFRVLKPGRWMTVVFSNSKASVWNTIQVSLQNAGFVVAEVTALDKTQGSYRQVTSANAVKQDLVVSCYKPNGGLEDRFEARGLTDDTAWDFIRTHLKNLAVVKRNKVGGIEMVAERDARRLFDRMVAWFVRHNTPVPLSSAEFQAGLAERFPERDGMFFLPNQIDEYDKARMQAGDPPQRDLFVDDERTAIDWLTDFLKAKPSTYQEVHPDFTQKTGAGWRKHETKPELLRLLDENFLKFDGNGPVPSQIHAYLSSNWKELRNLDKNDPQLVEKARNRWFVPDPNKQQDVEARREKALLREFDIYKAHKGKKMKEIRLEVMRVGFKAAWAAKDYRTIIDVSAKVPDEVWQEDERLMMLHSMAETRLEAER